MNAFKSLSIALALLLIALICASEARPKRVRATAPDYEYRDLTDYSDSGVFVDSVSLKTTPLPRHEKKHHKTNRLSKLRRFFESRRRYYE
ncbi:hypothetical protein AAVH_27528 [Aphelenchoides avenae]|nr:hypothetical protein AAVH_27528 [Aphelenchus avenae]